MTTLIARAILRHIKARAGADQASWAAAMEAECHQMKTAGERLNWALGCLVASYRMKPPVGALGYAAALLLAMGSVGLFNWRVDEGGVDMGVLVLSSLALGLILPRRAWLSGLLVGLVIPMQGLFSAITGLRPIFERNTAHPPRVADPGMLIFVVVALAAALLGGWIGRVAFRRSS